MTARPKPLRIKRLTLTDFRAFPGPAPVFFDFDSKNLLIYGENGAGKSSIFHALTGFFSIQRTHGLLSYKNVFSGEPESRCAVAVEFNDGSPSINWHMRTVPSIGDEEKIYESHPAATPNTRDSRVTRTALRRACLDYRALLDTNYLHGEEEINLFEIAREKLMADYPVTVSGGVVRTIGELWRTVEQAKPLKEQRYSTKLQERVTQACVDFNNGFNQALSALHPHIGLLLAELIGEDVIVKPLKFGGVTYSTAFYKRDRKFEGRTLKLDVNFRTHNVVRPQHFLNEARLSALALSIYLAGRLACTPTATPDALKLLVLDDVLIGLDHSNRLPVLEVLHKHFADWQIVLMTHDRVWFEIGRFYFGSTNQWKCLEIFEGEDIERGIPSPIMRPTSDKAAKASLGQARLFLSDNHIPAAANYTRAAFELTLKSFCERFGVPVAFKSDPRHLDTECLLSAVEAWLKNHNAKVFILGFTERVKLFRKVVLNPYSHAAPPNIARAEVKGAIAAVEALLNVTEKGGIDGNPLEAAQELIVKTHLLTEEIHAALGFLRAAFITSLRTFCERKHVRVPYQNKSIEIQTLWKAVIDDRERLFPPPHDGLFNQIEAEKNWLISPVTETDLIALTHPDLLRIAGTLTNAGSSQLVLDAL